MPTPPTTPTAAAPASSTRARCAGWSRSGRPPTGGASPAPAPGSPAGSRPTCSGRSPTGLPRRSTPRMTTSTRCTNGPATRSQRITTSGSGRPGGTGRAGHHSSRAGGRLRCRHQRRARRSSRRRARLGDQVHAVRHPGDPAPGHRHRASPGLPRADPGAGQLRGGQCPALGGRRGARPGAAPGPHRAGEPVPGRPGPGRAGHARQVAGCRTTRRTAEPRGDRPGGAWHLAGHRGPGSVDDAALAAPATWPPPALSAAHLGLAAAGLAAWTGYLATGLAGLAWAGAALLIPVTGLGMSLVFLAPGAASRPGTGPPSAAGTARARHRPPVLVLAGHIVLASATILLAFLAAIGAR